MPNSERPYCTTSMDCVFLHHAKVEENSVCVARLFRAYQ